MAICERITKCVFLFWKIMVYIIYTFLDQVILGLGLPLPEHLNVMSFPLRVSIRPCLGIAWTAGGTMTSTWKTKIDRIKKEETASHCKAIHCALKTWKKCKKVGTSLVWGFRLKMLMLVFQVLHIKTVQPLKFVNCVIFSFFRVLCTTTHRRNWKCISSSRKKYKALSCLLYSIQALHFFS